MTSTSLPKIGDRLTDYVVRVSQLREFKKREGDGGFCVFRATTAQGSIACIAWNTPIAFKNGDFLKISGDVKAHKEAPQLVVGRYEIMPRSQFALNEFVPVSKRALSEMLDELRALILQVKSPSLAKLLQRLLLDDPQIAPLYHQAPAAKTHHHPFLSGLLEHSLMVARRSQGLCLEEDGSDPDLVIAGALLHDIGKIEEYSFDAGEFGFTEVGNLLGHVALGYAMVRRAIHEQGDVPSEIATNLLHIILSHQGRLEYGSPVEPRTLEAFIVHHADTVDTHTFQLRRAGEEFPESRLGFAKSLNRMVLGNPEIPYDEGYQH